MKAVIKRGDNSYKIKFGGDSFTRITILDHKEDIYLCNVKFKKWSYKTNSVKKVSKNNVRFLSKDFIDELDTLSKIKDFEKIQDTSKNLFLETRQSFIGKLKDILYYPCYKVGGKFFCIDKIFIKDKNRIFDYIKKYRYGLNIFLNKDYNKIEYMSENDCFKLREKYYELSLFGSQEIIKLNNEEYKAKNYVNNLLLFKNINKEHSFLNININDKKELEYTAFDKAIELKLFYDEKKVLELTIPSNKIKKEDLKMIILKADSEKEMYLKIKLLDEKYCYYYYNKKTGEGKYISKITKSKNKFEIEKANGVFYLKTNNLIKAFKENYKSTKFPFKVIRKGELYNFYTEHYSDNYNNNLFNPLLNIYDGKLVFKNKTFYPISLEKKYVFDMENDDTNNESKLNRAVRTIEPYNKKYFWVITFKKEDKRSFCVFELIDFKKGHTIYFEIFKEEPIFYYSQIFLNNKIQEILQKINYKKLTTTEFNRKKSLLQLKLGMQ